MSKTHTYSMKGKVLYDRQYEKDMKDQLIELKRYTDKWVRYCQDCKTRLITKYDESNLVIAYCEKCKQFKRGM